MKLKEAIINQKFYIKNGNGDKYKKISDNGHIATYNSCICLTKLEERFTDSLERISFEYQFARKIDKEVEIVLV